MIGDICYAFVKLAREYHKKRTRYGIKSYARKANYVNSMQKNPDTVISRNSLRNPLEGEVGSRTPTSMSLAEEAQLSNERKFQRLEYEARNNRRKRILENREFLRNHPEAIVPGKNIADYDVAEIVANRNRITPPKADIPPLKVAPNTPHAPSAPQPEAKPSTPHAPSAPQPEAKPRRWGRIAGIGAGSALGLAGAYWAAKKIYDRNKQPVYSNYAVEGHYNV